MLEGLAMRDSLRRITHHELHFTPRKNEGMAEAPIPLFLSFYLAAIDKVAGGTLAAGIFFVLLLLHQLPQMELLKAWGIEAKMRARLGEAEEIMNTLRKVTEASARFTYYTLGWGSRTGGSVHGLKQEIADLADESLRAAGFSDTEVAAIKCDYMRFAALDIFFLFDWMIRNNITANIPRMNARGYTLEEGSPEQLRIRNDVMALNEYSSPRKPLKDIKRTNFRAYCYSRIPEQLPESDREVLRRMADHFAGIVEACNAAGRVDDNAGKLIDCRNEERREVYHEWFGEYPLG